MVVGVLAHEIGHITGGHLARTAEAGSRLATARFDCYHFGHDLHFGRCRRFRYGADYRRSATGRYAIS